MQREHKWAYKYNIISNTCGTTVTKLSLKPGSPPSYYTVSRMGNALYTREQLQLIDEDETAPNESARRKWTVEKILKKQNKDGLVHYLVMGRI